jgi:hypothetical protein
MKDAKIGMSLSEGWKVSPETGAQFQQSLIVSLSSHARTLDFERLWALQRKNKYCKQLDKIPEINILSQTN